MTQKAREALTLWIVVATLEFAQGRTFTFFTKKEAEKHRDLVAPKWDTVRVEKVTHKAGDGCTEHAWSDSRAGTIVGFSPSGKTVYFRRDKATLLNGPGSGKTDALKVYPGGFAAHWEGTQRYSYEEDLQAPVKTARLRKDGKYRIPGSTVRQRGGTISLGHRGEHYDYNF